MTRLFVFAVLTVGVISVGFFLASVFVSGQVQTAKRGDLKPRQAGSAGYHAEVSRTVVLRQPGMGI